MQSTLGTAPTHEILTFTEPPLLNCLLAEGAPHDAPIKPSWNYCTFCGLPLEADA